jgi:hypothetical protein
MPKLSDEDERILRTAYKAMVLQVRQEKKEQKRREGDKHEKRNVIVHTHRGLQIVQRLK